MALRRPSLRPLAVVGALVAALTAVRNIVLAINDRRVAATRSGPPSAAPPEADGSSRPHPVDRPGGS